MASGNTLAYFSPLAATFPPSNPARLDMRNYHPMLRFAGSGNDEEVYFEGYLPANYAGGGLSIDLEVGFSSATSGNSRWQADLERLNVAGPDVDADSFVGIFQSVGIVPNATSGITTKGTIALTSGAQMDSLAAGERFRLKIRRDQDGTSGTDDVTTDAELYGVTIRET